MTVIGYTFGLLSTGVPRLPQQRTFGLLTERNSPYRAFVSPHGVLEHGQ
jgi:hypothetical protein